MSRGNKYFLAAPVEFALPSIGAEARIRSPTFSSRKLILSFTIN